MVQRPRGDASAKPLEHQARKVKFPRRHPAESDGEASRPPLSNTICYDESAGGGGGIRTHGTREGTHAFQACPIVHSGTPPEHVEHNPTHPSWLLRFECLPVCQFVTTWRRGWDSNPRYRKAVQRFSRPPRSTTPAPLHRNGSTWAVACPPGRSTSALPPPSAAPSSHTAPAARLPSPSAPSSPPPSPRSSDPARTAAPASSR